MVTQQTWNPVTKEWDTLTPEEWQKLKAGFRKDADIPLYNILFRIDTIHALKKYTETEHDETVALFFIDLFIKMGICTLSTTEMYHFALWCRGSFDYAEVRKFYAPIYLMRRKLNEAIKLSNACSSTSGKRRKNRRK